MSETLDPKHLNNISLVSELKERVRSERKITAEILTFIREIDRRRLYLEYSYTSLFGFLTLEVGYTKASAQRRIDSSRLLSELPEIKEDIESGLLNLSQVSMVAQSFRQSNREKPHIGARDKRAILELIKGKDLEQSQKAIAKALDLKIIVPEKKTFQQDESIRLEITLTKEEYELLTRVKELISHVNPNPTIAELMTFLTKDYLQRKDPLIAKVSRQKRQDEKPQKNKVSSAPELKKPRRKPIKATTKREIFQRHERCQWKNPQTNQVCGSKFQLQIDHKHPIWAGGDNKIENLQLLCRIHNVLKYRREVGLDNHGIFSNVKS